ncbi:hypothetical protein SDRG_08762 [Saprolegnia diclina VS20]|uniref:RING-type domain-containing protein n=1 Tax=Saprolegnia diclina (strain VS20) TaxID=1156394 RepID=T0RMT8_SAPDV|nr:hypothetical protein SDRG_08762 [Saprolegnia diclina VS20]EQC33658.1 hypothetical protein SDRG_08762 [Saprolegnia diclina VS20]|eukprot:XP_008612881.1 hypothetical protein SDRG_08762 [Saprolegnia diclina VS20]
MHPTTSALCDRLLYSSDDDSDDHLTTVATKSLGELLEIPLDLPRDSPQADRRPALECPVCLDAVCKPVATKCGHVFCDECLMQALQRAKHKCPVCRRRVTRNQLLRLFI